MMIMNIKEYLKIFKIYRKIYLKIFKDLFKLAIDKDHYKPILVKSGYNGNHVQYESKGDKILTLKEYLALIENYLRELINYYKNKGEWKVQLIAEINLSLKPLKPGSDETCIMHTRSDNIEIMIGDDNDDIIEELFKSFLQKYEENQRMRGSDFEFDGVNFLYYDFNER